MTITIKEARYGSLDVTQELQTFIDQGHLSIPCNNAIFGDPDPGVFKDFCCIWTKGGLTQLIEAKENEILDFTPKVLNRSSIMFQGLTGSSSVLEINGSYRTDSYLQDNLLSLVELEFFVHDLIDNVVYEPASIHRKLIYGDLIQLKANSNLPNFDLVYINAGTNGKGGLDQTYLALVVGSSKLKTSGYLYLDLNQDYALAVSSFEEPRIKQVEPCLWTKA